MGNFLDLLANTIEGAAQATINTAKAVVGVAVVPLDGGETIGEAVDGILDGLHKVGNTDTQSKEGNGG